MVLRAQSLSHQGELPLLCHRKQPKPGVTSKHLARRRKSIGQTRLCGPKQALGRMTWSCVWSIVPSPGDAESLKGSYFCSPHLLPLPEETSLLKRNTYLSSEQSKHESKRSECRSVNKDGVIVTNSRFKAEPQRFCIVPLTFPYHRGWSGGVGWEDRRNVFQSQN